MKMTPFKPRIEILLFLWVLMSPLNILAIYLPGRLPSFLPSQYICFIVIFVLFLWVSASKKSDLGINLANYKKHPITVLLFVGIFSTLISLCLQPISFEFMRESIFGIIDRFILFFAFFSFTLIKDKRWFIYVLSAGFVTATILGLETVYNFYHSSLIISISNRIITSSLKYGFLGMFFVIPTSLFYVFFLNEKNIIKKILFSAFCLFFFICILLTYARSAFLAIVFSIFFISFFNGRKTFILSCIIAVVFFQIYSSDLIQFIKDAFIDVRYNFTRLDIWEMTIKDILAHWLFGTGLAGIKFVPNANLPTYRFMGAYVGSAHNNLLDIGIESGFLGIFCFLWLVIRLFKDTFKTYLFCSDLFYRYFTLGVCGILIGFLVGSFFGDFFIPTQANAAQQTMGGMIYMWFLLGMVESIRNRNLHLESKREFPERNWNAIKI